MKYFLTFFLMLVSITACKKTEQPQSNSAKPNVIDTGSHEKPAIQIALEHLDRNKMKTPEGTIDIFTNLPPGGPIPPDLLPAKDIKFLSKTDSTITYSFRSGTNNKHTKIILKKVHDHGEIIWFYLAFEPMPG